MTVIAVLVIAGVGVILYRQITRPISQMQKSMTQVVNMPNMDGLTMAEKVRGELSNIAVAIIMLTTENSPSMKERGKAAGIKGWIVKPFKGDAVLATFKKLVGM